MPDYFVSFWATKDDADGNPVGSSSFMSFRPQRDIIIYDDVVSMSEAIRNHIGAKSVTILNWRKMGPHTDILTEEDVEQICWKVISEITDRMASD